MHILIINHNAGSIKHGMELRPYYFARQWVREGHRVTVIAANFIHNRIQNVDCEKLTEEWIEGIRYVWLPVRKYFDNDETLLDSMQDFAKQLMMHQDYFSGLNPNFVIDSSTHPLASRSCYAIAQANNAKYIVEIHDPWELLPMNLTDLEGYNKIMREAEYFRYSHADKIISALPNLRDYLTSYGIHDKRFWYIPNGVNLNENIEYECLCPTVLEKLQGYKDSGKMLLGYAGSFELDKALDILIEVAKRVRDLPIQFVLLGNGLKKSQLKDLVYEYGLDNVTFLDAIPRNQVHAFLTAMDCLYAGWRKNDFYRYGMSYNKIAECMLSSRPIIHSVTTQGDLVEKANCGFSVPAEDIEAIVVAVKTMLAMSEDKRKNLGCNGRDYVARLRNYTSLAHWYMEICRML